MRYYCNYYKLLRAIVTFCLVGASALDGSWEKGLLHCDDHQNTRPPTLEDISMFVQDSWIYAALISLPEGDSIIIMKRRVDGDKTCYGNCNDTCQICDDGIHFNRSKASIKPQLGIMIPRKPYILNDNHFEDFPQPDICLEYLFYYKILAFRDCKETRPVQCLNGTRNLDTSVFETTACYQPSTLIPSCLPLPPQKNNHFGASALDGSWEKGLLHCYGHQNTRQPTLEDISMFVQDSWIYAALISLPEGDSIIMMKSKADGDKTCIGNCNDSCQICDDGIVFNRSKASIKPQLGIMVPRRPYIHNDNHFEDFPQPDICLEYLFDDKMLAFRDCNETRPVQCMNDTGVFETTACFQPSTLIPSCLPLPLEKNNHCNFREDCTVGRLFQEFNVYVVTLVGAAFIYGMINIIFIMCTVKYLLKKLTNRVSS
uniref:Uncharacterized protein LOC111133646 isoform X2 n=1 Tax=Crassostrea virginica TaxID=6565 RepID=A0A8B8EED7_CRAVI|nr:uncharacterized protein LOC111133646 isoform X2 [Crassostrea virginica]